MMDRTHNASFPRPAPGIFGSVLLLFCVLVFGCESSDFRLEAIGPEAQLTVVIDSTHWEGPIGEAVREHVATQIATLPNPETAFDVRQMHLSNQHDFEQATKFKNILFVAPLSDTTNEAKFLKSLLSDEAREAIEEGRSAVVPRTDVWRNRQQVFYVTAATPEALAQTLREDGPGIRRQLDEAMRGRLYRDMFDQGRQGEIEEYLMEHHGFAVHGQHDYVIALDTTNFVWLRRVLSDTWRSLFVYYEDDANPAKLTPEWVYATRDSLARRYLRGTLDGWVEIDRRRPLETDEISFLDRYALETRGLWHMVGMMDGEKVQFGMGGPFLTYAFYDQPTGRLYLIDGMVFAPNFDKREFLRQMEVIAYTFRTRQEAEAAEGEQVAASAEE